MINLILSFFIIFQNNGDRIISSLSVNLKPDLKKKSISLEFSIDSVIDNRIDPTNLIGLLGKGKRKTAIVLKKDLASSIKYCIQSSYGIYYFPKSSYIFKINSLECSSSQEFLLMYAKVDYEFEILDASTQRIVLKKNSYSECLRLIIFGSTYGNLIKASLNEFLIDLNNISKLDLPD